MTNCRVTSDLRDLAVSEAKAETRQQIVDARVAELVDQYESDSSGEWMEELFEDENGYAIEFIAEIEWLAFKGDPQTALIDIKAMFERKHRQAAEQVAERESND